MSAAISFQPLQSSDLESAYRLSTQAGWNQTSEDWQRLLRLNRAGTGVWRDKGEIRASFTVVGYSGIVAWIGMILVDETYRGGGLGKATFEAALSYCRTAGYAVLGLDATHLGEPIYRKYGFVETGPITRWRGRLEGIPAADSLPVSAEAFSKILEMDFSATQVDRSALLRDLHDHGGGYLLTSADAEGLNGYAFLRPGRTAWHLGPMVGKSATGLSTLLAQTRKIINDAELICDVLNPEIAPALQAAGLQASRHLKRMTVPHEPNCLSQKDILLAAGFELG